MHICNHACIYLNSCAIKSFNLLIYQNRTHISHRVEACAIIHPLTFINPENRQRRSEISSNYVGGLSNSADGFDVTKHLVNALRVTVSVRVLVCVRMCRSAWLLICCCHEGRIYRGRSPVSAALAAAAASFGRRGSTVSRRLWWRGTDEAEWERRRRWLG